MKNNNRHLENRSGLNVGVVGAGLMGRWHADAIRRIGANLAAVADAHLPSAQALASRFGNAAAYVSLEEMLRHHSLQVVHICTPLSTHFEIARQCLEAGVHLLIEKPLTPSASETEQLLEIAQQRRLLVCPVHQFLFQDGVRKAARLLPRLGELISLEGTFHSAGGMGHSQAELDEIVADILPHPLSMMQYFLSDRKEKRNWRVVHPASGEFRAIGQAGTRTLGIAVSMGSRPTICAFRISGTHGSLAMNMFHGYAFFLPGRVSRATKILQPFSHALREFSQAGWNLMRRSVSRQPAYPGLRYLIRSFYRAVLSGADSPIPAQDVVAVARERELLMEKMEMLKRV